ncbi:MAG: hypothetical protein ACOX7P_09130 [Oscillospiraceae bacterium]|jgi:hypothetical protein
MSDIAVNNILFLIKGLPEGLLTVLALYIFTGTKIEVQKYLLLSLIFIVTTYLIRLLPIALGFNTVLSLFILIIVFQSAHKIQLPKMIRTIVSAVGTFILIAVAEVFNMLLLIAKFGRAEADRLFNAKEGLVQSLYTLPSTIFFAIFVLLGYFVFKRIEKRKKKDGETGAKTGE